MAMQVADLEAVLKLNDKDYKKGMQEAETKGKKSLDSISKSSNNMSKNVSQNILSMGNIVKIAFAKLAYEGTQAFIGLGKAAINYTSDLKELENVLSVTFGDRFNAIALNADVMGKTMGRSSLQMRGMVAQSGALGKGLGFVGEDLEQMSINLAKTAVDMGSFFNVADEEAFTALRAALTGETENMKRFGIVMTENNLKAFALQSGVKKLWKELSEAEKTQIRYNYILEKTSFFAGDAEKTIGSTANQMKVLKARLGDLYQQVGSQLEPAWNDFLGTLIDSIEEIVATEEATHGLATALETILDGANIAIEGIKNLIVWYQKFSSKIGNPFEKLMTNKEFEKIKKNDKEFLKFKEELFKKEEELEKKRNDNIQKQKDIGNGKLKASNEETKKIQEELKTVTKEQFEARKGILEAYEVWELDSYDRMVTNTKTALEEMINATGKAKNEIGQNLIDALGFYVQFTQGMTEEIKKQVAVIGAQGAARSYIEIELKKIRDKGREPTLKESQNISKKAGEIAVAQYNAEIKVNKLKTGDQGKAINAIAEKFGYKPFEFGANKKDWVSGINGGKGTGTGRGGTGNAGTEKLTLRQFSSQYEAEKKAFEEYAKQRQLTEEEKNKQLLQINDSYARQAIDNGWLEYANTLSTNANTLENTIKTNEELKKAQEDAIEEEKKTQEELNKIYDESANTIQQKIQNEKDYALEQQKIQDEVFSSLSQVTSQDELKKSLEELYGKYSSNGKIIEYINSLYPNFLSNLDKQKFTMSDLSNVFSETSKITGELATLFEDDLLGAMSSLIGVGGNFATSLMKKDVLGSISSGLALVNQLDSFLNDSDIGEKQEEANTKFQEAVESFKKSVENFSLGQKISFAKLEKPSNLANVISGTGDEGLTFADNFDLFGKGIINTWTGIFGGGKPTDASLDTTALQQQLNQGGYGDIDVNSIFGKYAQYDTKRNWYGKKESYISGYDTAGAMAEINELIEEAWQTNMDGFAEALGLSSQDFISNMVNTFKSGGSIAESVNDMFKNAVIEAFFNQQAFEALNKNFSGAISEKIMAELTTEGLNMNIDFKGMSFEEMMIAYTEVYGTASDKLKAVLEKLTGAAGQAADQLSQVSTKNLPSGLKVASAEFQSTNASYGQTYQTIYQIENNYSKDFSEMVATSQNQSRFNQTGNARRSY